MKPRKVYDCPVCREHTMRQYGKQKVTDPVKGTVQKQWFWSCTGCKAVLLYMEESDDRSD